MDRKSSPRIKLVTACHENPVFSMFCAFSDAYLPKLTVIASLVNLPTKKTGITLPGFTLAIPLAINNGVVGRRNNV